MKVTMNISHVPDRNKVTPPKAKQIPLKAPSRLVLVNAAKAAKGHRFMEALHANAAKAASNKGEKIDKGEHVDPISPAIHLEMAKTHKSAAEGYEKTLASAPKKGVTKAS